MHKLGVIGKLIGFWIIVMFLPLYLLLLTAYEATKFDEKDIISKGIPLYWRVLMLFFLFAIMACVAPFVYILALPVLLTYGIIIYARSIWAFLSKI
ncbi:unnamed protein product [Blepharisma stoltei]|uniref:Uncharacterized protein n=1 Tax=Blepharisma stoltei TaxID=1481888 RepID=A0AAU9IMA5_9CILI|nr:unnamed protein product [Blepharisma stoltei]